MADNVELNAGTGGATVATDDVSGVQFQKVKLDVGADGVSAPLSNSNPIPVSDAGGALTVDAAELTAIQTATEATQAAVEGTLTVSGTVELGATALAALETITVATVTAALPAGNNNIGDVDVASIAAGDNNIGNVDIVTMPAVAGGAAQDAAITGNPVPVGLRASTATPTAMSADGDVVYPWGTREGATVVAGAIVDDAAFTPGTSRVLPVAFQADETGTDSVDEGDAGCPRMSLDRKQYVIAHAETSSIYQNGTARTPVFVAIDAATSGDNTLLAAQGSGNKIRVHQLFLVSAGTVNVRFESAAGGTALTGQMNLVANTGFVLPYSPIGWFETAANALLNLELSAAVSVDGNFAYTVVT